MKSRGVCEWNEVCAERATSVVRSRPAPDLALEYKVCGKHALEALDSGYRVSGPVGQVTGSDPSSLPPPEG